MMVDFGAESAFGSAAARVREHYGIQVPVSSVRKSTLHHAAQIGGTAEKVAARPEAKVVITEMDGSMVPIVQPGTGPDKRKGKKLIWREARLCCARSPDAVQPLYGATLGSVAVASWMWSQTARLAGCGPRSQVHGVGDGAPWLLTTFEENFAAQGTYTIDFYHVSEYLAAAAPKVARPGQETPWRRRQQGRLLNNQRAAVLRALEKGLEDQSQSEAPVRAAYEYINQRRAHLDYAAARKKNLPIGSGEIESGHRHVIQQRLKLSGGWWTEKNMERMLQLRSARSNGWWDSYWTNAQN
ncbi:MAG: UPF0236 family transposase-like protein [Limisphaerales bacterium]